MADIIYSMDSEKYQYWGGGGGGGGGGGASHLPIPTCQFHSDQVGIDKVRKVGIEKVGIDYCVSAMAAKITSTCSNSANSFNWTC